MHTDKNFPSRYSLLPQQRREAVNQLRRKKRVTSKDIREMANHFKVAAKTIHQIACQQKIDVVECCEQKTPKQRASCSDPSEPIPDLEPETVPSSEPPPSSAEDTALQGLADMEESIKKERDAALESLSSMEDALSKAREEVEAEREKAREAIRSTAAFRESTKEEREMIETLRGDLSLAQYRLSRMTAGNTRLKASNAEKNSQIAELKDMVRRLIETMNNS